eukprot:1161322-Pelagomonas_calceolata.AAC.7
MQGRHVKCMFLIGRVHQSRLHPSNLERLKELGLDTHIATKLALKLHVHSVQFAKNLLTPNALLRRLLSTLINKVRLGAANLWWISGSGYRSQKQKCFSTDPYSKKYKLPPRPRGVPKNSVLHGVLWSMAQFCLHVQCT